MHVVVAPWPCRRCFAQRACILPASGVMLSSEESDVARMSMSACHDQTRDAAEDEGLLKSEPLAGGCSCLLLSTLPYMQQQDMPMASEASIEGIGSVRGRGCRRPCSQTAVAVSAGRQTIRACELGRSSLKREMQPPPFLVFPSVAASGGTWCDHAGPE